MIEYDEEGYRDTILVSGILSLYDDDEICGKVDCNLIKNLQFTKVPVVKEDKYYMWSEYFRNKTYEFLYENKTASVVLKEINEEKSFINSGYCLKKPGLISFYYSITVLSLIYIFIIS